MLRLDPKSVAEVQKARHISARLKPSRKWQPLRRAEAGMFPAPDGTVEHVQVWVNQWYTITARSYDTGWPIDGGPWAKLGIYCEDGEPRHDWRDMQRIKNDIVGPEWEAVELFPAESRLVDPSNYYILWCAPKMPFGLPGPRFLLNPRNTLAPQRPWSGDEPLDADRPHRK